MITRVITPITVVILTREYLRKLRDHVGDISDHAGDHVGDHPGKKVIMKSKVYVTQIKKGRNT